MLDRLRAKLATRRRLDRLMDRQAAFKSHSVGRFSYGCPRLYFANSGAKLRVGQFCSIADDVRIFLGGEHRTDWVSTFPFSLLLPNAPDIPGHPATRGDVVIGNDVWIGHGAVILSGTRIEDGAVIGAQSVVSRVVPAYSIFAGNPARFVRTRFNENQIASLLALRWWDWPLERITAEVPWLLSRDVDAFVERNTPGADPAVR